MLSVVVEVTCYASICHFLVMHDRSMGQLLTSERLRRRTRKNVIDLAGHGLNFACEMGFLIVFSISSRYFDEKTPKIIFRSLIMSAYGGFAIVSVIFSPLLRNELREMLPATKPSIQTFNKFCNTFRRSLTLNS